MPCASMILRSTIVLKFCCSLQNNMFPERGIVFDFFFQKVGSTWAAWEDMIERSTTIPQGAKVRTIETKVNCNNNSW